MSRTNKFGLPWSVAPYGVRGDSQAIIKTVDESIVVPALPKRFVPLLGAVPDLLTVAELGKVMRDAQTSYFKSRSRDDLIASKKAEKEFDEALKAALAKVDG